jgi:hypothetical protein
VRHYSISSDNGTLPIKLDWAKKTKGEQTNYVCTPDVEDMGKELGLGTKPVPPERRRKYTTAIL